MAKAGVTVKILGQQELESALNQLGARAEAVLEEAVLAGAEVIRKEASNRAPRRTGRLAKNIVAEIQEKSAANTVAAIGPSKDAFYGCILGGHAYVTTDKGTKSICCVKLGDKVLTQTGEFRTVIQVYRYPTVKGMKVVDIEVEYRRGQVHKLTLTPEHKVLVFRDRKNKWVPAGELLTSDLAYCRRKKSWSEGTAKREERTCEWCGIKYIKGSFTTKGAVQGKRFCSHKCRIEWNTSRHRGMKRNEQSRARMSEVARKKLIERPDSHPNRIVAQRGHITSAERIVAEWLDKRGVRYERQVVVREHIVDFFLPDQKVIIEADGAYWHRDQTKDIERDQAILEFMPEATIVHVHFYDERFTPTLNTQPLPNVFYIVCNPGPTSFVDPETFIAKPILAIKQRDYVPTGRCPAKLYDLSVEGVHSFLASGILVSNSFVELGTVKMRAQPFLFPALEAKKTEAQAAIREIIRRAVIK